ncbi:MAG: peptidase U32 family protein, partial [Verrucomicrobiae bacterium]|nr:peptidase U32 family protein [Verrucomicrobiae bacterium]
MSRKPELMSPAGDRACMRAAIENGADSIYFGLERFNARMRAENFTMAELPEIMADLHARGVKGYVTFNVLVFAHELREARELLEACIRAGVDAVIVQDPGMVRLARALSPDLPIHASTQMTVTGPEGVHFAEELGCDLVVLARETSIPELDKLRTQHPDLKMPLEMFVHGALCVAYSGQCLTSESLGGRSANRGECAQACRMPYELVADGKPVDLGDRHYLLSPQDLAGVEAIPDLIRLGISCLKIEGRLKAPEYVANITRLYRKAIDEAWEKHTVTLTEEDRYSMEMGFSRGLYPGWFHGVNHQELAHARFAKKRGVFLGSIASVGHDHFCL